MYTSHLTCHCNGVAWRVEDSTIIKTTVSKGFQKAVRGILGSQNVIIHLELSPIHITLNSAFAANLNSTKSPPFAVAGLLARKLTD